MVETQKVLYLLRQQQSWITPSRAQSGSKNSDKFLYQHPSGGGRIDFQKFKTYATWGSRWRVAVSKSITKIWGCQNNQMQNETEGCTWNWTWAQKYSLKE